MNMTRKIALAITPFIVITGCDHPQPVANNQSPKLEGYKEKSLGANSYKIEVHGNPFTTYATLVKQFKQRAYELCNQKAFDSSINEEVSTNLVNAVNKGHGKNTTTVNQTPYVTGKITCSQ